MTALWGPMSLPFVFPYVGRFQRLDNRVFDEVQPELVRVVGCRDVNEHGFLFIH